MVGTPPDEAGHAARGKPRRTDEELLAAFVGGNEAMFGELVRRYERPLHALICRLTGDPAEAPDVFQETFIRVFRHAGSFTGRSRFKTWLYAVAANVCRSHARAMARRQATGGPDAPERPDQAPGPDGVAQSKEIGARIGQAVAGLPADQREVLVLKLYEELTYAEIAQALGRPLGTVKSQMRAALKKLRPQLRGLT